MVLSGKDFEHKYSVVQDFKRCSDKLWFSNIVATCSALLSSSVCPSAVRHIGGSYQRSWRYRHTSFFGPVAPSLSFIFNPCADTKLQGNPFSVDTKYTGVGKISDFWPKSHLSRKRYEIGPWLLWSVNRKWWAGDRYVSVSMTLSDP